MQRGALILVLGLLAGCQDPDPPLKNLTLDEAGAALDAYPRPPYQIIDRIEARIEGKPCIGRLDGWRRTYSYDLHQDFDRKAPVRNIVDERHILLNFREVRPGTGARELGIPGGFADDSPGRVVLGRYDHATGQVWIDYCGANFGNEGAFLANAAF